MPFFCFCRTCICQSPSDGEGSCKSDWRRSERQQLCVYQWEVCHHQEHPSTVLLRKIHLTSVCCSIYANLALGLAVNHDG